MFVCGDCAVVFEYPRRVVERHGQDTPPYEEFDVCPACMSTAVQDAMYCDDCREVIMGKYIELEGNGQRYCESCYIVREYND